MTTARTYYLVVKGVLLVATAVPLIFGWFPERHLLLVLRVFVGVITCFMLVNTVNTIVSPQAAARRRFQWRHTGGRRYYLRPAMAMLWIAMFSGVAARHTEFTLFWSVPAVATALFGIMMLLLGPSATREREAREPSPELSKQEQLERFVIERRRVLPWIIALDFFWIASWTWLLP